MVLFMSVKKPDRKQSSEVGGKEGMMESRLHLQSSIGQMITGNILGTSFLLFLATDRYTDVTWHNRCDRSTRADCKQLSPVIVKHAQF